MLEQIVSSFLGSSEAGGLVKSLTGLGLTPEKATAAVSATAEGTKAAVGDAGIGGLLALASDDGGPLSALGGLLGGGGGGLGGLLGGGGGAPTAMMGPMVDQIAGFVASKVGIDAAMAKKVVGMVLPKIIDVAKSKGGGGMLGGLLG